MRTNFQTWLNSLTNDDGSGTTGDLLNVSWFTDQMDVIGGDLDDIDADINALQNVGFLSGYDSVVYTYKDADTITIQAGGQFTVSDDSTMVKVAASTDLKLSTGRSTDCAAEAANTLYYLWGGQTALGATAFYFHTSSSAMPSELAKGKRIRGAVRNDNSSNILPFFIVGDFYQYNVATALAGSDETEVFDGTMDTNFVNVDCSGFVPPSSRVTVAGFAAGYHIYWRPDGSSQTGIVGVGYDRDVFIVITTAAGIVEAKCATSQTTRISVVGYYI